MITPIVNPMMRTNENNFQQFGGEYCNYIPDHQSYFDPTDPMTIIDSGLLQSFSDPSLLNYPALLEYPIHTIDSFQKDPLTLCTGYSGI